MKKKLALVAATAIALSLAMSLAACSNGNSTAGSNATGTTAAGGSGTISIGGIAPLTGAVAVYGTSAKNGAEMAFEEINAAGGVLDKQIAFNVLDDKGDVTESVNAYNRHMGNKVNVIWGSITSKPTLAVAQMAAKDGILLMTPTASQADITTFGSNIFRTCFLDPTQGTAMANFASTKLEAKTAAILYNTSDDYSGGLADAFKAQAESLGMTIVANEGYGATDKDFKSQLTKIASAKPDVLFVPDYYGTDALVAIQAREAGITVPILGGDGWDGVVTSVAASNISALNDVYFSNHYSLEDSSEKVQNFVKNYKAKYGEDPTAFAALGYDSAYMIAEAIKNAGGLEDNAKITKAMADLKFEGVTGSISFSGNGDPIKSVTIIRIVDGKYTFFDRVDPK